MHHHATPPFARPASALLLSLLVLAACGERKDPAQAAGASAPGAVTAQATSTPPSAAGPSGTSPAGAAPLAADTSTAAGPATPPKATPAAATAGGGAAPYKVVDGYKVDPETMKGFRAWRSAACDRCHGPNQEGMVGPSLITSLKSLSKEQFATTVTEGRLDKGMPAFKTNAAVTSSIDQLYAYLKGRSDGAITRAKVEEIQ